MTVATSSRFSFFFYFVPDFSGSFFGGEGGFPYLLFFRILWTCFPIFIFHSQNLCLCLCLLSIKTRHPYQDIFDPGLIHLTGSLEQLA